MKVSQWIFEKKTICLYLKRLNRQRSQTKQNKITPTFRPVDDRPSSGRRTRISSVHRFLKHNSAMQSRQHTQSTPGPLGQRWSVSQCINGTWNKTVHWEAPNCNRVIFNQPNCWLGSAYSQTKVASLWRFHQAHQMVCRWCMRGPTFMFRIDAFHFSWKVFQANLWYCNWFSISCTVANLVMEYVGSRALCEFDNPLRLWKRYIDDTLVVISQAFLDQLFAFLNNIQPSIKLLWSWKLILLSFFGCISNTRSHGKGALLYLSKPTHTDR